ncbi:MAG TPA: hypothetical protein VGO62_22080 [Myxococcota bacterium]|jgi:hypothetical protein
MLGFIVGTACLIGLIKVLRGGRRWHNHGWRHQGGCGGYRSFDGDGCGHRGWHGHHHHHGFGGFGGGRRGFDPFDDRFGGDDDDGGARGPGPVLLRGLFERLRTTPGQERVIAEALRDLRGAFKKSAESKAAGAKQVAEAMRGAEFKTENMGEAFAHVDESNETIRDATFAALAKIHEALDERQRKQLADLIGRGASTLEHLAEQA